MTIEGRSPEEKGQILTVYERGGEQIVVEAENNYYFLYRKQGISIQVAPTTHWWCAWLCTSTTKIDRISFRVELTGPTGDYAASGECNNCGSLDVMGPSYWGYSVPAAYSRASYAGTVRIKGETYEIDGVALYS